MRPAIYLDGAVLRPPHAVRLDSTNSDSIAAHFNRRTFGSCLLTAMHTLTMASENLSGEVE
jgi:hypothetical protein